MENCFAQPVGIKKWKFGKVILGKWKIVFLAIMKMFMLLNFHSMTDLFILEDKIAKS